MSAYAYNPRPHGSDVSDMVIIGIFVAPLLLALLTALIG